MDKIRSTGAVDCGLYHLSFEAYANFVWDEAECAKSEGVIDPEDEVGLDRFAAAFYPLFTLCEENTWTFLPAWKYEVKCPDPCMGRDVGVCDDCLAGRMAAALPLHLQSQAYSQF